MGCASSSDAVAPTAVRVTIAPSEPTFFAIATPNKRVVIEGYEKVELPVKYEVHPDVSCEFSLVQLSDLEALDTSDEDPSSLNFSKAQNSRVSALSSSGNKSVVSSPHRGESFTSFCQRMPRAAGVLRVKKSS